MESKNKKSVFLSGALMVTATIGLLVAAYSQHGAQSISKATTTNKSLTLDKTALSNVTFEQFDIVDNRWGGKEIKHDKKFRIALEGGNYILGAILYHDCGNQYIGTESEENATLGDAFTMNNVNKIPVQKNAYNFNIVFALDNIDSLTYYYTTTLKQGEDYPKDSYWFYSEIKAKRYTSDGTDASFYSELTTAGYKGLLQNHNVGKDYYDFLQGSSADNFTDNNPITRWYQAQNLDANMVVIQFNNSSNGEIDAGKIISFAFNSITFNYHCNEK